MPDLPGCIAVGETRQEVVQLIREAMDLHTEGLKKDGLPSARPMFGERVC